MMFDIGLFFPALVLHLRFEGDIRDKTPTKLAFNRLPDVETTVKSDQPA